MNASLLQPLPLGTIQQNLSKLGKDANGRMVLKQLDLVDLGLGDLEAEVLGWVMGQQQRQDGSDVVEETIQEKSDEVPASSEEETPTDEMPVEETRAEAPSPPPQTFTFKNIQILHLQNNHLTHLPPLQILSTHLPSISILNLANNKLTSDAPLNLEAFPNLIECNLANNVLTSFHYTPSTFSSLLRRLNLSNNKLTDIEIRNTPQLAFVDLSRNELTGDALQTLSTCALRQLNVANNHIEHLRSEHLCPGTLQELNAQGNQIALLDFVPDLTHLKRLNLAHNAVAQRDEILHLRSNRYLKEISLDRTPLSEQDDEYAEFMLSTLPALVNILDGEQVTAVMKVKSANYFGADAEHRDQVLHEVFGGEGDD